MGGVVYRVNPNPPKLSDDQLEQLRKLNPSYDPLQDIENAQLSGGEPEGPPDPKDNLFSIIKWMHEHPNKQAPPGLWPTVKTMATHPMETAMGAVGGLASTVAQIPQQASNIVNEILPWTVDKQGIHIKPAEPVGKRLSNIAANIPLFGGIYQAGQQAGDEYVQRTTSNPAWLTPEQKTKQFLTALGGMASSVLPGDEASTLLTGQTPSGDQATPEQLGENIFSGLVKTAALHGAVSSVLPGATPSGLVEALQGPPKAPAEILQGGRSSGEIAAAGQAMKQAAVERGKALAEVARRRREAAGVVEQKLTPQAGNVVPAQEPPATQQAGPVQTAADLKGITVDEQAAPPIEKIAAHDPIPSYAIPEQDMQAAIAALPPELKQTFGDNLLLGLPAFKHNVAEFVSSPIFVDYLKSYNKDKNPIGDATVRYLINPDIAVPWYTELGQTYTASMADLRKAFGGAQERSAEYAGQVNQVYSAAIQQLTDDTIAKANNPFASVKERVEAKLILKSLADAKADAKALSSWGQLNHIGNQVERLRLSQMVSPIATMVGYSLSHGATAFWDTVDAANMALVEGLKSGGLLGKVSDFNSTKAYGDLIGNYISFVDRLGWQRQKLGPEAFGISPQAATEIQDLYRQGTSLQELAQQYKITRPDGTPDPKAVEQYIKGVPRRYLADFILNENPRIKQRFLQDIVFDGDSTLFSHTMSLAAQGLNEAAKAGKFDEKGLFSKEAWAAALRKGEENAQTIGKLYGDIHTVGQGVIAGGGLLTDLLNIPHRAATQEFRKYFFRARLESNIRLLQNSDGSAMTLTDAIAEMRKKELDDNGDVVPMRADLRDAINNAEVHALKNTYSYNPQGGLLGGILSTLRTINKNLPLPSTAWLVPFPRFAINNILWQVQHSPVMWFDMFEPALREKLYAGAEQGLTSMEAQRSLARATTGLALVNSAYAMAQGHPVAGWVQGPKPYLLSDGSKDKDGNLIYLDARYFKPYVDYLYLGHIIDSVVNNKPLNMTADEFASFVIDSRVSDIGLFNIGKAAQDMVNAGEISGKPLEEAVGDYLGSWTVFWRGIRNEGQAAQSAAAQLSGHPEQVPHEVQPALDEEPIMGGILAGANPGALPPRVDPYKANTDAQGRALPDAQGNPQPVVVRTENPILHITKLEQKPITPFQELMLATPGAPAITPNYGSVEANNLVRKYEGLILNDKNTTINGQTLQQVAKTLLKANNPKISLLFLRGALEYIHTLAVDAAVDEAIKNFQADPSRPYAFADYAANKEAGGVPGLQDYIKLKDIQNGIR